MNDPPQGSIWAAGGVLGRRSDEGTEFLVVHRDRYDDWSLPKGKVEAGETFLEAALREVGEETGHDVGDTRFVGTTGYETPLGDPKVVRWWLMEAVGGSFAPNGEVDDAEWLTASRAVKRLSYRGERRVLRRAATMTASPRSGVVYLVRHALAGTKAEWDRQDWLRPLDRDGVRQAKRLTRILEAVPFTRIVSSHYKRCVETVRPLALAEGIELEKHKEIGARGDAEAALALIGSLGGESAVVSTHGEVIGDLITRLDTDGVPLRGPRQWRKGSFWVMQTRRGVIRRGRYVEPV